VNPKKFLAELQRRNVYKVAVAYCVVSWLLIQVATQIFPVFEIPTWAVRLIILALALGFPVALVLAWAYELTPEGVKRTEEINPQESISRSTGRKLDFAIIGVLVVVIAVLAFQRYGGGKPPAPAIPEKSIAVLPFENRSEEKANAYFADGIQDEILTRLSKISDLRVISRTSTQQYESAPENLREVGKQLGVAHLLEGSVQKVGNNVRINVRLIRAATHQHLWAESYNRKLDDVFAVESEVAGVIADKLNLRLSGAEKQDLAARPTHNPEAHDAYLRGVASSERSYLLEADAARATQAFENAVTLDPNFALAWARLSRMHSVIFQYSDASAARRDSARNSLQRALQLQPSLLEAQLADAYYSYRVIGDYDRAREILKQVHSKWPNNAEAPHALALVARRQGRWDESLGYFHEALGLDPRNVQNLTNATITAKLMRQYQTALKLIDRALDIAPGDNSSLALKASIYQALGQLDEADAVLAQMHTDASNETAVGIMADQYLLRHDYRSGTAFMQSTLANLDPARRLEHAEYLFLLGNFQKFDADTAGAQSSYAHCRDEMKSLLREQADNPKLASWLALATAALGDKESALKLQEEALGKVRRANNLFEQPIYEGELALLQAQAGDRDRAIITLQRLLSTNGAIITPALLRLDPNWDSLRDDPRFQALTVDKTAD
jgi:TolB-like protein/Tfp pilus assembly protein PilF